MQHDFYWLSYHGNFIFSSSKGTFPKGTLYLILIEDYLEIGCSLGERPHLPSFKVRAERDSRNTRGGSLENVPI
jgi:hypothetical protein